MRWKDDNEYFPSFIIKLNFQNTLQNEQWNHGTPCGMTNSDCIYNPLKLNINDMLIKCNTNLMNDLGEFLKD